MPDTDSASLLDLDADLFRPVTGTFHTSWWGALKWSVWIYGPLAVLGAVLFALTSDPSVRFGFGAGGVVMALWVGAEALAYRLWGARRVEITPEALVVEKHGREPETVRWADLQEAYMRSRQSSDSWLFKHGHARTTLPERGFTTDDWLEVCRGIEEWKVTGPLATLPGVETERQRPGPREVGPVFKAHQPSALFWGIPFFLLMGVVGLVSSWEAYGDGSWTEDVMMSVGLPLFGFGFVALALWSFTRAARRITFGPRTMLVERYIGAPLAIPYAEVLDAWGNRVRTRRGLVLIGDRNGATFQRLLDERLSQMPSTPEAWDEDLMREALMIEAAGHSSFGLQIAFLLACLVGGGVAGWWFGLGEGNTLALSLGALLVGGVLVTLWTRRRAKRWIAEAEREHAGGARPPEASGG